MKHRLRTCLSMGMALLLLFSSLPMTAAHADDADGSMSASDAAVPVIPEESTFFATAYVDEGSTYNTASMGDLWPSAWSNDGNLYLANGDGWGWTDPDAPDDKAVRDIAFSKITSGHPNDRNLTGERISFEMGDVWSDAACVRDGQTIPAYNRKPTGLVSSGGTLWLAVQDLNQCPGARFFGPMFNDAPNATILKSTDKGVTWTWDEGGPMFSDHRFTTIFFLDWGQDGVDNKPDSDWDDYIYAYGMDYNWRDSFSNAMPDANPSVPDPTKLFLARIPADGDVQSLTNWQFWTGGLNGGTPSWSVPGDLSERQPVLQDDRRIYQDVLANFPGNDIKDMSPISQGSVTYNRSLDRFIYLSWTEYTYEFYESPTPWGPWKRFLSKDFGPYNSPWKLGKNGGYTTVMPSKYISGDGKEMWFSSNSFEGPVNNYHFSLRRLYVAPHNSSLTPANEPNDSSNLARTGDSNTPVAGASVHQGDPFAWIDGMMTAGVDDWNGERKTQSYWGVTWSKPYRLNKAVYSSGNAYPDGGYFGSDLKVQVRQNFEWVDVTYNGEHAAEPDYPADATAANQTFTFRFDDTWGDGIRIIGSAGGDAHFTTIVELEAYYATEDGAGGGPDPEPEQALLASKAAKIARVTGEAVEGETLPDPNRTDENWGLTATDLGIMWDATTADRPTDKKVMVAFGDSYDDGWGGFGGGGDPEGWRSNLLALSNDEDLTDGLSFSSMIADASEPDYAKEIISSAHDVSGSGDFTAIPTAGVTAGNRHFIHYMQIKNWGANGRWNTNFSELAYSDDDGQTWTKSDVKWGGASKFAQAAYAKDGGYVYMFGTPAGRFDSVYLARAAEADMLDKTKYEYWNGSEWLVNQEAAAAVVVEAPVSELSVAYNTKYGKWIMLYLNENRAAIVMRSSSSLTSGWSAETEVVKGSEFPGLYGGFIHPWSGNGDDLYFLMSEWGPYNVFLMKSSLRLGNPSPNLVADFSFEQQPQAHSFISSPWNLEFGNGGIDKGAFARAGKNNVWLRNNVGWNAITQTVSVTPNTEYRLTAFARTSANNNNAYFGVRNANNSILKEMQFERLDNYTPLSVRFNSGSNSSVIIFTGMHTNGDTWIQLDDFYLLPVDVTPPSLSLRGQATMKVTVGKVFADPGADADDETDGDLTRKITVSGAVDTSQIGTYTLMYTVTDAEGNTAAPLMRTVHVEASSPPPPIEGPISAPDDTASNPAEHPFADFESEQSDGQATLNATIDSNKLAAWLADAEKPAAVIDVSSASVDKVSLQVGGSALKAMEEKKAGLDIFTTAGNYRLPSSELLIGRLARLIGELPEPAELKLHIEIAKGSSRQSELLETAADKGKFAVIAPPVDFRVSVTYKGNEYNADTFGSYVQREIPVPEGAGPQSVTTAVVVEADGSLRHAPTYIVNRDGNDYAVINSLTNSAYALISHKQTFADTGNHWGEAAISEMSSRLIVYGTDQPLFLPEASVTRAEFTAMLVRALGLSANGEASAFTDVAAGDWYAGAAGTALQFGLIEGYDNGSFRPEKSITREEAAVMLVRAMKLAGIDTAVGESEAARLLSAFADGANIHAWAGDAVAAALRSGIIEGSEAGLQPQRELTRAEGASILLRLLRSAELID